MQLSELLTPYQEESLTVLASALYALADMLQRPCLYWRPKLHMDGNKWCALYGDNLQDGCAGFGDTPDEAMAAFDAAWMGWERKSEEAPDALP